MNNKVVLITWHPASFSSEHFRESALPSEGHSALLIELSGNKVYASFWPGKCKGWHREEPWLCQKETPHFHTSVDEDDLIMKRAGDKVELYGLDAEKMANFFKELHDENMNSHRSWRVYNNCSDIVLKLLEEGGLFRYDNASRYNINVWLPIVAGIACSSVVMIGIMNATIYSRRGQAYKLLDLVEPVVKTTRRFITDSPGFLQRRVWSILSDLHYFLGGLEVSYRIPFFLGFLKFLRDRSMPSMDFPSNIYVITYIQNAQNKFIAELISLSATSFISAFLGGYVSSMIVSSKSTSPFYVKHSSAYDTAIKIGLGVTTWLIAEAGIREVMLYNNISRPSAPILPMEILVNHFYIPFINKALRTYPKLSWSMVLGLPLIILGVPFFMRSFYDTTITPKYVLSLVNERERFLQEDFKEESCAGAETPVEENVHSVASPPIERSFVCGSRYHFFSSIATSRNLLVLGATVIISATAFFGVKNIESEIIRKLPSYKP